MAEISRRTLLLTGCALPFAAAANSPPFAAAYRLSLGGFRLGDASLTVAKDALRYDAAASLRLSGLARWLFDADATASARGRLTAIAPEPDLFESDARFGEDRYRVVMRFDPLPAVEATPPLRPRAYDAPVSATVGALDPLSAAVALCTPQRPEVIGERVVGLYDGRRRVDVAIGTVKGTGDTLRARAMIRRVAGFKAKHMAEPPMAMDLRWDVQGGVAVLSRAVAQTRLGAAVVVRET